MDPKLAKYSFFNFPRALAADQNASEPHAHQHPQRLSGQRVNGEHRTGFVGVTWARGLAGLKHLLRDRHCQLRQEKAHRLNLQEDQLPQGVLRVLRRWQALQRDCASIDCKNNEDFPQEVAQAKLSIKEGRLRNCALAEKLCNCKKSGCLKRYCECFNSGVGCFEACKCEGFKSTEKAGVFSPANLRRIPLDRELHQFG